MSAIRPATPRKRREPRIRVKGLAKRYGALEVFRNIDFDVGEREIVAMVGPSGCGKTTLLRCIDGLLPHDAGEIWVGNQRVEEPIAGVAMVFQHFGLFPWKTVYDNVAYGLRMAGAPKAEIERKVPEFIKLVGLAGFETAFPYQMSGGMQQRCGLARALAVEPNVLLMDEPFAAVDAQTREILQFELLRIWEERPTAMIFVTHSIEEAVLLGHRVIVLKGTALEHPRDHHHRSAASAHARDAARAALRRIARAGVGHADAGGARSRIPFSNAEQEQLTAKREDSMIRKRLTLLAGGALLAALLARRPGRGARQENRDRACPAFRRSIR